MVIQSYLYHVLIFTTKALWSYLYVSVLGAGQGHETLKSGVPWHRLKHQALWNGWLPLMWQIVWGPRCVQDRGDTVAWCFCYPSAPEARGSCSWWIGTCEAPGSWSCKKDWDSSMVMGKHGHSWGAGCECVSVVFLWDLLISAEVSEKPGAWINKSDWIFHECMCPKTKCTSVSQIKAARIAQI